MSGLTLFVAEAMIFFWGMLNGLIGPFTPSVALTTPRVQDDHPLAGVSAIELKMEYDLIKTRYPIVYLSINGSEPLPFLFDTGYSGHIIVDEPVAKRLNLPEKKETGVATDGAGKKRQVKTASVNKLQFPSTSGYQLDIPYPYVYVDKLGMDDETVQPKPCAGIVGVGMFVNTTVYISWEKQTILLVVGEHKPLDSLPEAVALPMKEKGRLFYVEWSPVPGQKPVQYLVDTGAITTSLPADTVSALKPKESMVGASLSAFDRVRTRKLNKLPQLNVGKYAFPDFVVYTENSEVPVIGLDVLSRFRVGMDFRRNVLTLEPTRAMLKPSNIPTLTGLVLGRKDGKLIIAGIANGVPESLKSYVGKEVLSIDSVPTEKIAVGLAQAMLDGNSESEVVVKLLDGITEKEVLLKRISQFKLGK